jgi:hypothetical protein
LPEPNPYPLYGVRGRLEPDVAAAEAFGLPDSVDRGLGAAAGGGEAGAEGGDAERPAAIGKEPPLLAAGRGVKDLDPRVPRCRIEGADLAARSGSSG